jgi:hypothetical protein
MAEKPTSFSDLVHSVLDRTLVLDVGALRGQRFAGGTEAGAVHGLLEHIVLPAEHIVGMLAISGALFRSEKSKL